PQPRHRNPPRSIEPSEQQQQPHHPSSGIPTLHPSPRQTLASSGTGSMRKGSRHSRSVSHPFPSLFWGKRSDKKGQSRLDTGGLESTDDDLGGAGDSSSSSSPTKIGKSSKQVDTELVTGHCMTCASLVRWPKNLQVFKCTICLM